MSEKHTPHIDDGQQPVIRAEETPRGIDTSLPADEFMAQVRAMRAQVTTAAEAEEQASAERQKILDQERAAKAAAGKPQRNPRDIEVEERQRFVESCAKALEKGDGLLFNEVNKGRLLYVPEFDSWFSWATHYWKHIWPYEAQQFVENVAQAYTEAANRLRPRVAEAQENGEEKKQKGLESIIKGLRARTSRLHEMKGINACMKAALSNETRLTAPSSSLDCDDFALVTDTGVVDIRTGIERKGRPQDHFTRHCSVPWQGIDAPCPKWEKMLFEILGEDPELLHYMHKLLGMAICGDTSEKIFVVLLGAEGDSGKTTIFEILYSILTGHSGSSETGYAAPMPVELLLDQGKVQNPNAPTPVVLELRGQRICWASEPGEGTRFSVDKVKLMSGDDSLVGRSPYDKSNTKFRPTHTLFLLTNHKMKASANDSAFWKRIKLINCPFSFVSHPDPNNPNERLVNKNLKREILAEEGSGVLAWLVRGYQLYSIEGLPTPESVKRATAEYRREEDIVLQFMDACLEPDEFGTVRIPGAQLYAVFRAWFEDAMSRKGCPSITTFGKLAARSIPKDRKGGKVIYTGYCFNDYALKNYPQETKNDD